MVFITYPFDVVTPAYISSLRRLTVEDKEDIARIKEGIKKTWKAEKSLVLKAVTDTYSQAGEGKIDPNAPAKAFTAIEALAVRTIKVPIDHKTERVINIYMPIASKKDDH